MDGKDYQRGSEGCRYSNGQDYQWALWYELAWLGMVYIAWHVMNNTKRLRASHNIWYEKDRFIYNWSIAGAGWDFWTVHPRVASLIPLAFGAPPSCLFLLILPNSSPFFDLYVDNRPALASGLELRFIIHENPNLPLSPFLHCNPPTICRLWKCYLSLCRIKVSSRDRIIAWSV